MVMNEEEDSISFLPHEQPFKWVAFLPVLDQLKTLLGNQTFAEPIIADLYMFFRK